MTPETPSPEETVRDAGWYSPKLPKTAVALRVWRADNAEQEIRNYYAVTFPKVRPWVGCDLYLRRLGSFGMIVDGYTGIAVDVIDANEDILHTWAITPKGLAYLRRELNLRMEPRRNAFR